MLYFVNIGSFRFLAEQHMVFRVVLRQQRAKKVVSDSSGQVDFAFGLVNSVFNLPNGQVMCLSNSNNKNCEINSACQKAFGASRNDIWASKC